MKKLLLIVLLLSLLTYPLISCSRVQAPTQGKLKTVKLEKLDAIPTEYGSLVSVIPHATFRGWAYLWFEDDDRTIRIVEIAFEENRLNEYITVIPRN